MDAIFMNSENCKISKLHFLTPKLTDKFDSRSGEKSIALSNLSIYYTWTNIKTQITIINLKYQFQLGMINSTQLMDHTLYQIFRTI